MIKQIQFFGQTESGIFCAPLFGSSGVFEKTAGAPPFSDWETGDDIRKFIRGLSADQRKKNAYVLVNALGAGEFFGSNINADYFPWNALAHEGDDYGYKTFLNAHAFQHHKNKDPTRAFGKPVVSVLNPRMKRVELVIELNREKAIAEGADGVINRIDAGEFPDVSMGCKVPYDVCSICAHQSKTRADYCQHMMPPPELRGIYGPNKILQDGRKIYVLNTFPRFFDISFVFIGADKTAKVMAKLASKGQQVCLGDVCEIPRPSAEVAELTSEGVHEIANGYADRLRAAAGSEKTASVEDCEMCKTAEALHKKSAAYKLAEIVKEVPSGAFSMKRLPQVERLEPDLPDDILDGMSEMPLSDMLSGTSGLGVILKPHEFQRSVLTRMGEGHLADRLRYENKVFRPSSSMTDVSMANDMLEKMRDIMPLLAPYIHSRTAFGEPFRIRIMVIKGGAKPLPTPEPIAHPLLDKISAAYNGYRRQVMSKLSQAVSVVESDPKLREMILGENLVNGFMKSASVSRVLSLDSVAYVSGAHLADRSLLIKTANVDAFAAEHEDLLVGETSAQGY